MITKLLKTLDWLQLLMDKCRDGEISQEELDELQDSGSKLVEDVTE